MKETIAETLASTTLSSAVNTDAAAGSGAVERKFHLHGFRYAAQIWEPGDKQSPAQPVLALHGWLDNSASFDVIAPALVESCNAHILAPDLAGHGYSEHRSGFSDYPTWSEALALVAMVDEMGVDETGADEMGWEQFTVMGHSRGAMIAFMLAALFPERVSNLILIDAIAPASVDATQAPARMIKSMQEMQRRVQRKKSYYPSYDAAIQARASSDITQVDEATAKRLAVRGLSELEEGYHWHSDDKLWAFGQLSLTPEQIIAFAEQIKAKVLILMASRGFKEFVKDNADYLHLLEHLIELLRADVKDFDDGHYLHMEASAAAVAQTISHFMVACPEAIKK